MDSENKHNIIPVEHESGASGRTCMRDVTSMPKIGQKELEATKGGVNFLERDMATEHRQRRRHFVGTVAEDTCD